MAFVRTLLLIAALVLGWGAVRADPDMVFGLLGCAIPLVGRWGALGAQRPAPARVADAPGGALAMS